MGMSSGGGSGEAKPTINVTPLIDVLLVLLIIFMVITPLKPSRFEAKVPAEPKDQPQANVKPNPLTLVVAINKDTKAVTLNNEPFGNVTDTEKLTDKLKEIFKQREDNGVLREGSNEVEKTLFIKSPKSVRYGDVVRVIDAAKWAGATPIGLQVDDLTD
ncbi:MAG TPA: biopolymer transporter ExbD [Pyrinomonadaceae bacterium]|nr:biopolymer transporter ExbD [Chloracidobacterium sp.]MBP9936088.1 biopolymer transporter ExbD [Pyrinomonadaceae bacterium]MBK7803643.1 biopolymer transporter ExbD [Chloracidobacterium sp.]MBK9439669.1 biopolymer transporter ExbD [Chloracidobacterium sp.]MBL0239044.1 biopolymer transporter ExbD [Chloracidobacterium sp.]